MLGALYVINIRGSNINLMIPKILAISRFAIMQHAHNNYVSFARYGFQTTIYYRPETLFFYSWNETAFPLWHYSLRRYMMNFTFSETIVPFASVMSHNFATVKHFRSVIYFLQNLFSLIQVMNNKVSISRVLCISNVLCVINKSNDHE